MQAKGRSHDYRDEARALRTGVAAHAWNCLEPKNRLCDLELQRGNF